MVSMLLVLLITIALSIIGNSMNSGNIMGAVLGFMETLQYLVFTLFFNTTLPPAPYNFISLLFSDSIELGMVLENFIIQSNIKDFDFALHYDLDVKY